MPHINLMPDMPGILGPTTFSPETARPLNDLVNTLLRHNAEHPDSTLSQGDRELIATYVSVLNDCYFCVAFHGAMASLHLNDAEGMVLEAIKCDYRRAPISDKMKALLAVAGSVQQGGHCVTAEQVETARQRGATDRDIHDTVLIAAAFCMFNRYVDGLATTAPTDNPSLYRYLAEGIVENGYALG